MNPNLDRAQLLFQQSRPEMAEAELRQALSAEPHDAFAHALLALCLAQREKFDEANAEAHQAIHLQPDMAFAHYAHAHVLFDRYRFPDARAAIQEAIRLDPASADHFALLSNIEVQECHWRDALAAAERGLELDPEHVACTNLRAIAMVKLGRKAEAGATIDTALSKNPENSLTHANQGWTLLERGQPKKALEHFREALRLDPGNEWAQQGIVEALKARNIIYAMMLKYFLWMSRFSSRGQWLIILGGYFGNRILGSMAKSNPDLAPWLLPLQILYVTFALMTWVASPLFNLLLRVNRFGRLVLSREQTVASNWFGLCLLGALICLGAFALTGFNPAFLMPAMVFGLLLLPVSAIFNCASGWPRRTMAALTICLALLGFAAAANNFAGAYYLVSGSRTARATGWALFTFFLLGIFASTWIANLLLLRRQRR